MRMSDPRGRSDIQPCQVWRVDARVRARSLCNRPSLAEVARLAGTIRRALTAERGREFDRRMAIPVLAQDKLRGDEREKDEVEAEENSPGVRCDAAKTVGNGEHRAER